MFCSLTLIIFIANNLTNLNSLNEKIFSFTKVYQDRWVRLKLN